MTTNSLAGQSPDPLHEAHRAGFWTSALLAAVSVVALGLAVTTLPISGPFCQTGCVVYPFANVASYVPHDYIWMYPGILVTPLFFILTICLYQSSLLRSKLYGQLAHSFALLSAGLIVLDYFIQIAVLQPSLVKGETEGVALWSQYNPHGAFIALEDLGYLMMSIAFLCTAAALQSHDRLTRILRWLLGSSAVLGIGAFILLRLIYGLELEYRFEVTIITINWITLILAGVLFSLVFRRALSRETPR